MDRLDLQTWRAIAKYPEWMQRDSKTMIDPFGGTCVAPCKIVRDPFVKVAIALAMMQTGSETCN